MVSILALKTLEKVNPLIIHVYIPVIIPRIHMHATLTPGLTFVLLYLRDSRHLSLHHGSLVTRFQQLLQ